jgi:hypothetical protein
MSVNIEASVVYITSIAEVISFCHKKNIIPLVQNMTNVLEFEKCRVLWGYQEVDKLEPQGQTLTRSPGSISIPIDNDEG